MGEAIEARIALIEKFVKAKHSFPDVMVEICEQLLKEPLLEDAVRADDCLSMLIEHYHTSRHMKKAYACIREMEDRRIPLNPYVDANVLEEVFLANGAKNNSRGSASSKPTADDRGEGPTVTDDSNIDSDIEEDIGDGDSPIKNVKSAAKAPIMVAASKGYAPVREDEKKSVGTGNNNGNRSAAPARDLDESVEDEVEDEIIRNEAKMSAPTRQNRK